MNLHTNYGTQYSILCQIITIVSPKQRFSTRVIEVLDSMDTPVLESHREYMARQARKLVPQCD